MTSMTGKQQVPVDRLPNFAFYIILISLTLMAAALRLYQLGRWSLWIDEITTLNHAVNIVQKISPGTFVYGFLYGQSLSTILTGIAVYIWGTAEWAARLTPALTGILTVPVTGVALRGWVGGRVALLTSLFITLSAWHVYWSQNVRYLVMQLLIYTLLFILIYRCWQPRQYFLILVIAPLLFLLYLERLTGLAFVLITITLYILTQLVWQGKGRLRSMVTGRNILLLTAPIILFLGVFVWRVSQHSTVWLRFVERRNHTLFSILNEYYLSVRPLLFILGILGLVYVWRKYNKDHIWYLFTLAAIVPLIVIMTASFVFYTSPRYMLPAFIFWLALAALALIQLLDSRQRLVRLFGVFLLGVFLTDSVNQLWRYHVYQEQRRSDWKGAYAYVESQMSSDDIIVTIDWRRPLAEYYITDGITIIEDRDLVYTEPSIFEDYLPANGEAVVWFVLLEARIGPDLDVWLAKHRPQLVYETIDVKVYRYEPYNTAVRQ